MSYLYFKSVEELNSILEDKALDLTSLLFKDVNSVLGKLRHPYKDYIFAPDDTEYNINHRLNFAVVCGFNDDGLADAWIDRYDEYLIYKPFDKENAEKIVAKLNKKALTTIRLNAPKYQAMLYTLGADYNPIENYSMVERGIDSEKDAKITDELTRTGTETNTETGDGSVVNTTWSSDVPYDNSAEMKGGGTEVGSNTNTTPLTSKTISQQSPVDYSKTNELSYTGRTDTRTITHDSDSNTNQVIGDIISGGSADKGLTGDNVKDHIFTRSGNVGVTTSQQMLESEIALKREAVIQEFFNDFNKQVLLSVLEATKEGYFSQDSGGSTPSGDYVTKAQFEAAIAQLQQNFDNYTTKEEFNGLRDFQAGWNQTYAENYRVLNDNLKAVDTEVETHSDEIAEANLSIDKNKADISSLTTRVTNLEEAPSGSAIQYMDLTINTSQWTQWQGSTYVYAGKFDVGEGNVIISAVVIDTKGTAPISVICAGATANVTDLYLCSTNTSITEVKVRLVYIKAQG